MSLKKLKIKLVQHLWEVSFLKKLLKSVDLNKLVKSVLKKQKINLVRNDVSLLILVGHTLKSLVRKLVMQPVVKRFQRSIKESSLRLIRVR
ncbi:hypothetical protein D3C86_1807370 [compost metagenome]